MPTSLTDQMFQNAGEGKSLTDQMFEADESLTDQMFPEAKVEVPIPDIIIDIPRSGVKPPPREQFGFDVPEEAIPGSEEYFTRKGVGFLGLTPFGLAHPAISSYMSKQGFGPKPEGGWSEGGLPLNKDGIPYLETPEVKDKFSTAIAETFSGLSGFATQPMRVVQGTVELALGVSSFSMGLVVAAAQMAKASVAQTVLGAAELATEVYGPRIDIEVPTVLDYYNIASNGVAETMEYLQPGTELLLGQPTEVSQKVGEVAMVPLTGITMLGNKVLAWEGFNLEDHPNVLGYAKFGVDFAALAAMGIALHGRGRGGKEFAKDAEEIVKKADKIVDAGKVVSEITNDLVKQVQMKMVEAEANRLEIEAKRFRDKFSGDLAIIEEIGRQAERLALEKTFPVQKTGLKKAKERKKVEPTVKEIADEIGDKIELEPEAAAKQVEEAKAKVPEKKAEVVPLKTKKEIKSDIAEQGIRDIELGEDVRYPSSEQYEILDSILDPKFEGSWFEATRKPDDFVNTIGRIREHIHEKHGSDAVSQFDKIRLDLETEGMSRSKAATIGFGEATRPKLEVVKEPITDVDQLTGTKVSILEGENSAFFQDAETTIAYQRLFEERAKAVSEDVELFTQKLINDVNRWYKGDDAIDIAQARDGLSKLASSGDVLADQFITGIDHLKWREVTEEAAVWARGLDRSKLERTVDVDPNLLYEAKDTRSDTELNLSFKGLKKQESEIYNKYPILKDRDAGILTQNQMKEVEKVSVDVHKKLDDVHDEMIHIAKVDYTRMDKRDPILDDVSLEFLTDAERDALRKDRIKPVEIDYFGDPEPGPKLSMMIPLDQVPKMVKSFYKGVKDLKYKDVYRNKKLFLKTGFWLGRDGKWRYEIDDSKAKLLSPKEPKFTKQDWQKGLITFKEFRGNERFYNLNEVLDYPELYKIFPEIKDVTIRVEKGHRGATYYPSRNEIAMGKLNMDSMLHELQHKVNDLSFGAFKGATVPAYARDIVGARKKYFRDPGEMEARLVEFRKVLSAKEKKEFPPWESLDNMLRVEGIHQTKGTKLYSGIPLDKAAKEIVSNAKRARDYVIKARGMKAFKPKQAAQMLREEFNRSFVDRSGNIRIDLLEKLGQEGYRVVQKMVLAKGSSSISSNMLKQMQKEIYQGLNKNEKRILDTLIHHDRMIDLAKYKTEKDFKYFKEHPIKESIGYIELMGQLEKLTPKQVADMHRRAATYFEWMKRPLQDMFDAGLISQEELTALSSHNYQKKKLVEVFDKPRPGVGKKGRTIYDSGVEALARGRDTDIFEPSSEILALEVFNRSYGRIMNNEANLTLLDVARRDPTNDFVRIKTKGGDKIPSGWTRSYVYEGGERKTMFLSPEMAKEWISSSSEISYRSGQLLRWGSGSAVLRTFATGINWGFALANLPRDVMHTWFTARTFENGKWKSVYSPTAPVFGLQITKDLVTTFSDAALRKGRYEDYLKEGGGMEFLVHQGRPFQRGRHLGGPMQSALDFMGYFGETSEIMTRLAIRERVIRNRAKDRGLTMEQARKNKGILEEATFAARDYMDFGQGGGIAKAADNAFPYANAIIQGSRGLWRAFKPGSGTALVSTYKLAQFGALVTGTYIAMSKMHPETFAALKGNVDMQNNLVIPLGDDFGFQDEKGQTRYPYIKIPLDPGQKFFKMFFEASTDKWLGNEIDVNALVDSLKEQSPVGVTELPPTLSATLGYIMNKDFWLQEDIWRKTDKPFDYQLPKAITGKELGGSEEEYTPGFTPQAFIDLGATTGLSPERSKFAIEELVTGGTVWSYLLGQGYDELMGDLPKSNKEEHLAMVLRKIPVVKRFFGVTNPYSKYATKIEQEEEASTIKRFDENRGLDTLAKGYMYEKNVGREEVFKYIDKTSKDIDTKDRLMERFAFQEATKNLPERTFWLRLQGVNVDARARIFVDRLDKASPEQREQIWNEYAIMSVAGGVISNRFREEVIQLRLGLRD